MFDHCCLAKIHFHHDKRRLANDYDFLKCFNDSLAVLIIF